VCIIYCIIISAQTISGNLSLLADQSIMLECFNGIRTYLVSEAKYYSMGNFKLQDTKTDYGAGYLLWDHVKLQIFP